MQQRSFIALIVSVLVVANGCVHNPAGKVKESNDDITVADDGGLARGSEKLDEQDFYTLVNDKESAGQIDDIRSGGERDQMIGIPLAGVGVVTMLGGAYLWAQTLEDNGGTVGNYAGEYTPFVGYGVFFAGLAAAFGGGSLVVGGREAAAGTARIFDTEHARASLEKGLYGGGGATAAIIKSIEWASLDGSTTFCSISGRDMAAVVVKDEKGRNVRMQGRDDWIEYTSKPEGLVLGSGTAIRVRSPWTEDLTGLGNDIVVTATVKETGLKTSVTLSPDFGCPNPFIDFHAVGGDSGKPGDWGGNGSNGGNGADGTDGAPGGHGDDGYSFEIEATTLPFRGKTLVVAAFRTANADSTGITVHDAATGPLVVDVEGGAGGSGGSGGTGGRGGSGSDECVAGGNGGRGGRGGQGGNGGRGGDVKARVDGDAKALLRISVAGGSAGGGGSGGSGGGGGDGSRCGDSDMQDGGRGGDAGSGQPGNNGQPGKLDIKKQAKKDLTLLTRVLASAPKS